ncbi:MAG TPA: hypothetical protein VJL89_11315 [Thermodesulfovibrionia bacterium]|nr:hypothetical protein [Thermodesulfovibrionia bacterium]
MKTPYSLSIWSLSKFFLWNWKVDNHNISYDTEEKLRQYLADNDLNNVKVRLNQYNPGDEWSRLHRNKAVSAGWRYTLGAITVLGYTLLPGRLFGGDNYNPFTNTISVYSDLKPVVIHEAGHAKDMATITYIQRHVCGNTHSADSTSFSRGHGNRRCHWL